LSQALILTCLKRHLPNACAGGCWEFRPVLVSQLFVPACDCFAEYRLIAAAFSRRATARRCVLQFSERAVDDPKKLVQLVHRSTRITHTDPRAEAGALIVAAAARISTRTKLPTAEALFQYLNELEFDFAGSAESLLELLNAAALLWIDARIPLPLQRRWESRDS
jgi:hypothetical protein